MNMMDSRMSEDRIYTVYPYQSGKPPTAKRNRKFWIICAVIVCYVILVGIIVLVVLLVPRKELLANPNMGSHNRTEKPLNLRPTRLPFSPSPRDPIIVPVIWNIDPRSTAGTRYLDRTKYHGKYPDGWKINPDLDFYL